MSGYRAEHGGLLKNGLKNKAFFGDFRLSLPGRAATVLKSVTYKICRVHDGLYSSGDYTVVGRMGVVISVIELLPTLQF